MMFNLTPRHGQKSEFAGSYFECMKAPFLGTKGHIAMAPGNLEGAIKNIYLNGEYGGFAVHILRK